MGKSMRLGGGGRFAALKRKIEEREGYSPEQAAATAAMIGRHKYGSGRMSAMAAAGKRRARRSSEPAVPQGYMPPASGPAEAKRRDQADKAARSR